MIGRRLVLTAFSAAALASGVADARIRTGRAFVPGPEECGGAVVGQNNNPGGSCSLDEPCSGDDAGMCCSRVRPFVMNRSGGYLKTHVSTSYRTPNLPRGGK